jgi:chromosome segregation ATPase
MRERLDQYADQITSLDTQKKSLEISLANLTKDLDQANSMVRELSDENIRVRAELGVQERIETLLRQHQREIPQ